MQLRGLRVLGRLAQRRMLLPLCLLGCFDGLRGEWQLFFIGGIWML